jgi:hypothetical protein
MKTLKNAILAIGLIVGSDRVSEAGDHFFGHHTSTITTRTTTTGSPVLLVPTAQPVYYTSSMMVPAHSLTAATLAPASVPMAYMPVQAVSSTASPTVMYYYYQAQSATTAVPAAPVGPAAMTAPSLLAPASTALPLNNGSSSVAAPVAQPTGTATVESQRTGRLLQTLRGFAASNNLDRNTLISGLKNVGLFFLRAELTQYGLGGFVPSPTDNNVLEELVNRVVNEKIGPATSGSAEAPAASGNQFVFQGPVTLSFPNVQTVQIQAPTTTAGTPPANHPSSTTLPPPPANNTVGNPSGDAVPPAPAAPNPQVPPPAPR